MYINSASSGWGCTSGGVYVPQLPCVLILHKRSWIRSISDCNLLWFQIHRELNRTLNLIRHHKTRGGFLGKCSGIWILFQNVNSGQLCFRFVLFWTTSTLPRWVFWKLFCSRLAAPHSYYRFTHKRSKSLTVEEKRQLTLFVCWFTETIKWRHTIVRRAVALRRKPSDVILGLDLHSTPKWHAVDHCACEYKVSFLLFSVWKGYVLFHSWLKILDTFSCLFSFFWPWRSRWCARCLSKPNCSQTLTFTSLIIRTRHLHNVLENA